MTSADDLSRRATMGLAVGAALAVNAKAMDPAQTTEKKTMERALGIGGIFFKAKDPKALAQWYEQNFGIPPVPTS